MPHPSVHFVLVKFATIASVEKKPEGKSRSMLSMRLSAKISVVSSGALALCMDPELRGLWYGPFIPVTMGLSAKERVLAVASPAVLADVGAGLALNGGRGAARLARASSLPSGSVV